MDDWKNYFSQIEDLFSIVENQKVLELASGDRLFWPYILKYNPSILEGLDPAPYYDFSNAKVHKIGYEEFLPNTNYDVIFCFGLIYKLSNPLDLIERIANSNPKYILFENVMHYDADVKLEYFPEEINIPGNLFYTKNYKKVNWKLIFPVPLIINAFKELNYECLTYRNVSCHKDFLPKKETCVMLFKRFDK